MAAFVPWTKRRSEAITDCVTDAVDFSDVAPLVSVATGCNNAVAGFATAASDCVISATGAPTTLASSFAFVERVATRATSVCMPTFSAAGALVAATRAEAMACVPL
ncbi:hypothetical protein ACPPVV_18340 [Rhodanobacter sp. Col0626]|uniref:hypothetical protein n=1 Tax=Rhodanobacter sp. Col0626 TaxID=3415679 RepID=UPI003CED6AB3